MFLLIWKMENKILKNSRPLKNLIIIFEKPRILTLNQLSPHQFPFCANNQLLKYYFIFPNFVQNFSFFLFFIIEFFIFKLKWWWKSVEAERARFLYILGKFWGFGIILISRLKNLGLLRRDFSKATKKSYVFFGGKRGVKNPEVQKNI